MTEGDKTLEPDTQVAELDQEGSMASLAGKYLTFHLANEEYGLEILRVIEIIGLIEVTAIPRTPDYVKGVINLRGKVIPVVDLRRKFGLEEAEKTKETCIVVVDIGGSHMGIVVDAVSEVLDIKSSEIEPAPALGAGLDTSFILGMGKTNDQVTILLEIEKILNSQELVQVNEIAG